MGKQSTNNKHIHRQVLNPNTCITVVSHVVPQFSHVIQTGSAAVRNASLCWGFKIFTVDTGGGSSSSLSDGSYSNWGFATRDDLLSSNFESRVY